MRRLFLKVLEEKSLPVALSLNFVLLVAYLVLGACDYHDSLDDFFMSSVLTGAYNSQYDVHLFFINVVYGFFLKPFYVLFPDIGWYYLFQVGSIFCSFTVFCFYILKRLGLRFGLLLSLFFLVSVAPDFYFQINFTQCAAALTGAAILLLVFAELEKRSWLILLGILFLVAGYVMRRNAFEIGLPFFIALGSLIVLCSKKIPLRIILAAGVGLILVVGLNSFDRSLYSDSEYKFYAEYQGPRATIGDGRYYDYDATYAELEERGFSGKDFKTARGWMFYDTEAFAIDSIQPYLRAISNNRYLLNYPRTGIRILCELSKLLWTPYAWCWITFCLLLIACSRKKIVQLYPWMSLGIVVLCLGYLFLQNRVVSYVENSILLYAMISTIPFLEKETLQQWKISEKILGLIYICCAVFFLISFDSLPNSQKNSWFKTKSENDLSWERFKKFAAKHPEDAFMLNFEQYKQFAAATGGPAYKSVVPGSFDNIFPLGYWNVYLPGMKRELEKKGVQNPLKDVVKGNVYLVHRTGAIGITPGTFYEDHYRKKVTVDSVMSFGTFNLVKQSLITEAE